MGVNRDPMMPGAPPAFPRSIGASPGVAMTQSVADATWLGEAKSWIARLLVYLQGCVQHHRRLRVAVSRFPPLFDPTHDPGEWKLHDRDLEDAARVLDEALDRLLISTDAEAVRPQLAPGATYADFRRRVMPPEFRALLLATRRDLGAVRNLNNVASAALRAEESRERATAAEERDYGAFGTPTRTARDGPSTWDEVQRDAAIFGIEKAGRSCLASARRVCSWIEGAGGGSVVPVEDLPAQPGRLGRSRHTWYDSMMDQYESWKADGEVHELRNVNAGRLLQWAMANLTSVDGNAPGPPAEKTVQRWLRERDERSATQK